MAASEDALPQKARAVVAGAESELPSRRYDNVANRCYYACSQAAVVAPDAAGIRPAAGPDSRCSQTVVQAEFTGLLINRRKRDPPPRPAAVPSVQKPRQGE